MLQLGKETKVRTADGKTLTLSRLGVGVIEDWRDLVAGWVGDPFADLERFADKLPPEEASRLFREARDVRDQLDNFSISCPVSQKYLNTERGMARLFQILLAEHHPDATAETGFAVVVALGGGKALPKLLAEAQGEVPPAGNSGAPAGPSSGRGRPTGTPSTGD